MAPTNKVSKGWLNLRYLVPCNRELKPFLSNNVLAFKTKNNTVVTVASNVGHILYKLCWQLATYNLQFATCMATCLEQD